MNPDNFLGYIGRELETRFGRKPYLYEAGGDVRGYRIFESEWHVPTTPFATIKPIELIKYWNLSVELKDNFHAPLRFCIEGRIQRSFPLPDRITPSELATFSIPHDKKLVGYFSLHYGAGGYSEYTIRFTTEDFVTVQEVKSIVPHPDMTDALPPAIKDNDRLEEAITRALDQIVYENRSFSVRRHPKPPVR